MTDLIERLEALAGKVTPGDWLRVDTEDYARIEAAWRPSSAAVAIVAKSDDADLIALLGSNLPTIIAALKVAELVRDEDWLAERISDTLDMDWRPIDAARAIIAALPKEPDNAHD